MCHADSADTDAPAVTQRETDIPAGAGAIPATLFLPESGRGPGITLVSDIYGAVPFYRGLAARLAAAGYVVLLPDYFFRQGPLPEVTRDAALARHGTLDEEQAIKDIAIAADSLRRQPAVAGEKIGLLGFCLGGTIALDVGAEGLDAPIVCYYAFPFGFANPCRKKAPRPVDVAAKIAGPVLAHWGDADYIPLPEVSAFGAVMRSAGNPYAGHVYGGAGHGFLAGLIEQRADSAAAAESWGRTLEFFALHLGPER